MHVHAVACCLLWTSTKASSTLVLLIFKVILTIQLFPIYFSLFQHTESINATSQISHPVHPTTGLGRVPDSVFELKISHLQEEMILLQKQCIYYQQKNTQFRKEVTHYQQEISHSQQQNTHLQQENTHLQQESIRLQQSSIQLQQSNTLLQKENTQLKPEKARFQQMNTWFKHENTLLQQKNAQLQQKNTRLKPKNIPLQQENAQLQQENTRLQQENTWLQQENTQLKPENTRLQQENARLQQENTQLKPINTRLQQKNTWLQQENNQLKPAKTRLQQEKAQLQQENNRLKLAKTQLQQENAQLQQENTRLKPVNAQLQQENAQLQQENTQLKPVNTRLQQENTQLQQENTWLKPVNTQLQQENTQLRQEKTRLQQKNTNLQETVGRIQLLNTELQSKLDNQPKLGSDADISFWVVSHDEVKFTDRVLGEGGWGKVVVGSFRGQDVAVKQLHSLICSSDYFKDLFRREISIMAKVRHPNLLLFVAAVLDSPSKTPNIITELLDTNLRQAYHNGQLASNPVRLCILRDVSAALNYLHLQQNPIVHRDVSSANVLLQALPKRMWKGKLSDFGSANLLQFATTPGPGTAIYTAPEVFKGEQTPKMDVYSYGKLLCEVLTNRLPDPYAFPSMVQSMAENWPLMHQLISSCVEQDPTKRPPMSYIVDHLNQFTKRAK